MPKISQITTAELLALLQPNPSASHFESENHALSSIGKDLIKNLLALKPDFKGYEAALLTAVSDPIVNVLLSEDKDKNAKMDILLQKGLYQHKVALSYKHYHDLNAIFRLHFAPIQIAALSGQGNLAIKLIKFTRHANKELDYNTIIENDYHELAAYNNTSDSCYVKDSSNLNGSPFNLINIAIHMQDSVLLKHLQENAGDLVFWYTFLADVALKDPVKYPTSFFREIYESAAREPKQKIGESLDIIRKLIKYKRPDVLELIWSPEFTQHGCSIYLSEGHLRAAEAIDPLFVEIFQKHSAYHWCDSVFASSTVLQDRTKLSDELFAKAYKNLDKRISLQRFEDSAAIQKLVNLRRADILQVILQEAKHVDLNQRLVNEDTLLHNAVRARDAESVEVLINHGADYSLKNIFDETAFDVLDSESLFDFMEKLKIRTKVFAKDTQGLPIALKQNELQSAKILLWHGADQMLFKTCLDQELSEIIKSGQEEKWTDEGLATLIPFYPGLSFPSESDNTDTADQLFETLVRAHFPKSALEVYTFFRMTPLVDWNKWLRIFFAEWDEKTVLTMFQVLSRDENIKIDKEIIYAAIEQHGFKVAIFVIKNCSNFSFEPKDPYVRAKFVEYVPDRDQLIDIFNDPAVFSYTLSLAPSLFLKRCVANRLASALVTHPLMEDAAGFIYQNSENPVALIIDNKLALQAFDFQQNGTRVILEVYFACGLDPQFADEDGHNLLYYALQHMYLDLALELLRDYKLNANDAFDKYGSDPGMDHPIMAYLFDNDIENYIKVCIKSRFFCCLRDKKSGLNTNDFIKKYATVLQQLPLDLQQELHMVVPEYKVNDAKQEKVADLGIVPVQITEQAPPVIENKPVIFSVDPQPQPQSADHRPDDGPFGQSKALCCTLS